MPDHSSSTCRLAPGLAFNFFRRLFCSARLMWNQSFRIRTPSSASIVSKRLIASSSRSKASSSSSRSTKALTGSLYQEPKTTPIVPLGGRSRQ